MSGISGNIIAAAVSLINQDNVSALANMLKKKAMNAKERLSTAEGRESVTNEGVDALKKALDYIRYDAVKDVQNIKRGLNTFKDYAYQKTLNSAAAEEIAASITGEPTPEKRQRRLEKILYLYLMQEGLNMVPSINIASDIDSPEARNNFFKKLLGNEQTLSAIREMIRNLMILFFYNRIGVSAVQYSDVMNEPEIDQMYHQIVEKDRQATIDADIESSINNPKFIEAFLEDIIQDTEAGVANDSKYFGYNENVIKMLNNKLINFIKQHNYYVTHSIKTTRSLEDELAKLDKFKNIVEEVQGQTTESASINAINQAINTMIVAINDMLVPKNDKYQVYQLVGLDDILTGTGNVVTGEPILLPVEGSGKRRAEEAGLGEGEQQGKRPNVQPFVGGRRTRRHRRGGKRKATKKYGKRRRTYRKKGTMKKSRKGGMHHGKPHRRRTRSKK